jgi:hypothetical protein
MNVKILYESDFDLTDLKNVSDEKFLKELIRILGLRADNAELEDREKRLAGHAIEFLYTEGNGKLKVQLYLHYREKALYLLYHGNPERESDEYKKLLSNEEPSYVLVENRYSNRRHEGPVKLGLNEGPVKLGLNEGPVKLGLNMKKTSEL